MYTSVLLFSLAFNGGEKAVEPRYEFKLAKAGDIAIVKEAKRTLFVVTSQRGIGGGTITLKAGQWPENVSLRFQYDKSKGFENLEKITLTTDRVHVAGELKSSGKFRFCFLDAKRTHVVIDLGARETAGSLNVPVVSRDGALEVTLPACLLIGSSRLELEWI